MDNGTLLILFIQLTALSGIALALILYLLCKVNKPKRTYESSLFSTLNVGTGRSILITSCDTLLGIQLALHFTSLGFRVFAGFRPSPDGSQVECTARKILGAKMKQREALSTSLDGEEYTAHANNYGYLITVPLDVTREDSLHDVVDLIRKHLPAGEDGLWAVINTAGMYLNGKLEHQDSCQWENLFRINVFGLLRTARAFIPLLRNKNGQGRLITLGHCQFFEEGIVSFNASRCAAVGATLSLNSELRNRNVKIIAVHTEAVTNEKLFLVPKEPRVPENDKKITNDRYVKFDVAVLPPFGLNTFEEAILDNLPKSEYSISKPTGFTHYWTNVSNRVTKNFNKQKYDLQVA